MNWIARWSDAQEINKLPNVLHVIALGCSERYALL